MPLLQIRCADVAPLTPDELPMLKGTAIMLNLDLHMTGSCCAMFRYPDRFDAQRPTTCTSN